MNELLYDIPVAKDWSDTRKKNLLHSVMDNLHALDILTNNLEGISPQADKFDSLTLSSTSQTEMLQRAQAYAHVTKSRLAEVRFQKMISWFQKLVFVSFCTTMVDVGVPKPLVNSVMRICISNSGEKNLETLRR